MATTIKVTNVSSKATLEDVHSFFSHSGDVASLHLQSEEASGNKIAHVTFRDTKGVETAVLLTGSELSGEAVKIEAAPADYLPPESATTYPPTSSESPSKKGNADPAAALRKAEEMMKNLVAQGYVLGQDAISKAKAFDEKHALTAKAAAQAAALREGAIALGHSASTSAAKLDEKYHVTASLAAGTERVSQQLSEVDEKLHVSERTRGIFEEAEKKINEAGAYLLQNEYLSRGRDWMMDVAATVSNYVEGEGPQVGVVGGPQGGEGESDSLSAAPTVAGSTTPPTVDASAGDRSEGGTTESADDKEASATTVSASQQERKKADSEMPVF